MHPTLMYEVARYRQADMLREAERARLAHLASHVDDEPTGGRYWFRLRRRAHASLRPVLGS